MNDQLSRRRICWPHPDATCLEGGCGYCNDSLYRTLNAIGRYVQRAGVLLNRGGGEQPAEEAWARGLMNGFYGRVDVR